jgi:enoyl-CoA hydratase/carnithine racemase
VLVLTGAGEHFCAGADISELHSDGRGGDDYSSVGAERALAEFPKPTLAAVRGFCVGGGCQLAAACDLRFAADDARFGITPAKLGIVYPVSAVTRLVRLVGPSAAKYLLYSAELVDAPHALRVGLLDEIVPPGDLDARVAAFAATLTTRSQLTQQATKDVVDSIVAGTLDEARLKAWSRESLHGADSAEGIAAFLARRPPNFTWTGPLG